MQVGHTMGPPSDRSDAASRNAITPRRLRLDDTQPTEVPKFSRGYARTFPRNSGHNPASVRN